MTAKRPDSPKRRVTSTDVAELANVSQSAVSRVFAHHPSVSDKMRRAVLDAARTLGYRPNAIARSLITQRSRIIGVAMAYLDNQFYPEVLQSLSRALQAHGYQILLFTADETGAADPMLEQVLSYQVDALLLASVSLSSHIAEECELAGIPVILFNRTSSTPGAASVTGDNFAGGRQIAEFLVAGGHQRFAYIAGAAESSTNRDREAGFCAGLAALGMPQPMRVPGQYDWQGAQVATRLLLGRPTRPDAIFAASDLMAIACLETARTEFGLSVPSDLSVVGFDDVGVARWPSYRLTSFAQPVEAMVSAAVTLILERLESLAAPARPIVIPGRLIVRQTTRHPAHGLIAEADYWVWQDPPGKIDG